MLAAEADVSYGVQRCAAQQQKTKIRSLERVSPEPPEGEASGNVV